MTPDEVLAGWLAIARYTLAHDGCDSFDVPKAIGDAWIARGWQTVGVDGQLVITEAGLAASDLIAPEFGIDPIGAEIADEQGT